MGSLIPHGPLQLISTRYLAEGWFCGLGLSFVLLGFFYLNKTCVGDRKTECEEPRTGGPVLLGALHSIRKRLLRRQHYQQRKRERGNAEEEEEEEGEVGR